jgi:oxaloacetate decarboxylase beta subunit
MDVVSTLKNLWNGSGFLNMDIPHLIMIIVALALIYLAIRKKFEPLLLLPSPSGCCWPICRSQGLWPILSM